MTPTTAPLADRERVNDVFRAALPYYLHERARDWRFLAQQRRVCAMLQERSGRVLDIGCGPGLMSDALVRRGWEVWGVDCLEPAVASARAEADQAVWGRHAHYVAGDAETLPFPSGSFDAVIAMGVLEYLSDAPRFVAEVARVLRPGGAAVIAVPSAVAPYHVAARVLDRAVAPAYRALRRLATGSVRRGVVPEHPRHPVVPWRLDRLLAQARLRKHASAYSHFALYPLDRWCPDLTAGLDRRCTPLEESRLLGWLGTQYIVATTRH
jgi:ubiquinone/menaquinone biosynthesis C-methylase UbiE